MFLKLGLSEIIILQRSICIAFFVVLVCFHIVPISFASEGTSLEPATLLSNMKRAYVGVRDYQAMIEVRTYKGDTNFDSERFLYRFKKPRQLRIDVESPRAGTVLTYPDRNGKVVIRLPGFARFFPIHLSPDNSLLKGSSGQPINKTDLGLLIENIGHSLEDHPYRKPVIIEQDEFVVIQTIAKNHFREGVITNYRFFIDKRMWLPVRVEESTPEGVFERSITFTNLRINVGLSDKIFELDEPQDAANDLPK